MQLQMGLLDLALLASWTRISFFGGLRPLERHMTYCLQVGKGLHPVMYSCCNWYSCVKRIFRNSHVYDEVEVNAGTLSFYDIIGLNTGVIIN